MTTNDRLYKFILKCTKNASKPDLHSFTINVDGGMAFVDCCGEGVRIEVCGDMPESYIGSEFGAACFLEARNAEFDSIEM